MIRQSCPARAPVSGIPLRRGAFARKAGPMILPPQSRGVIAFAWVIAIANVRAPADVVWSGLGSNSNWTTPANWQGGAVPANDGTEQIRFDGASRSTVLVNTSQSIRRL